MQSSLLVVVYLGFYAIKIMCTDRNITKVTLVSRGERVVKKETKRIKFFIRPF